MPLPDPVPLPGPTPSVRKGTAFDFDWVLPIDLRSRGYRVCTTETPFMEETRVASLTFLGSAFTGAVAGDIRDGALRPHSHIKEPHRGIGLGTAAYEALLLFAQSKGVSTIYGLCVAEVPILIHKKLARKYGLIFTGDTTAYKMILTSD